MTRDLIPPHDLDAERSLLGALLLGFRGIPQVYEMVTPDDFYRADHRDIFDAVVQTYAVQRKPVDLTTIAATMRKAGTLDGIKGAEHRSGTQYLGELAKSAEFVSANAIAYAETVAEKSYMRKSIAVLSRRLSAAYDPATVPAEFGETTEREVLSITRGAVRRGEIARLGDAALMNIDAARARQSGKLPPAVKTGFPGLDRLCGGWLPGEVIVIAARPGMGKSALMINIAEYVAVAQRIPVGIISIEMAPGQLGLRAVCANAGVDGRNVRGGSVTKADFAKLEAESKRLASAPIHVDMSGDPSLSTIRSQCRRMVSDHKCGVIFIDYLQLMDVPAERQQNENDRVAAISRSIKGAARELRIPVVALAQLNRASASDNKPPDLHNLRSSGAIEQDADIVAMIHGEPATPNIKEIIFRKARDSSLGIVNMEWHKTKTRFVEVGEPDWRTGIAAAEQQANGYGRDSNHEPEREHF